MVRFTILLALILAFPLGCKTVERATESVQESILGNGEEGKNTASASHSRSSEKTAKPSVATSGNQNSNKGLTRLVQVHLNALGYDAGVVDGLYGQRTRRAIMAFEVANQIAPSGNVSSTLLNRLVSKTRQAGLAVGAENSVTQVQGGKESSGSREGYPQNVRDAIAMIEENSFGRLGPPETIDELGLEIAPVHWLADRRPLAMGLLLRVKSRGTEELPESGQLITTITMRNSVTGRGGGTRHCRELKCVRRYLSSGDRAVVFSYPVSELADKEYKNSRGEIRREIFVRDVLQTGRKPSQIYLTVFENKNDWAKESYVWAGKNGATGAGGIELRSRFFAVLGATVKERLNDEGELGELEVLELQDGGALDSVGFRVGDRIDHVNGESLRYGDSPIAQLEKALSDVRDGARVPLYKIDQGNKSTISKKVHVILFSGAENPCAISRIRNGGHLLYDGCSNQLNGTHLISLHSGDVSHFKKILGAAMNKFESQYDDMMIWGFLEEYSDRCRNALGSDVKKYEFKAASIDGVNYGYALGPRGYGYYQQVDIGTRVVKTIYLDPKYFDMFSRTIDRASKRAYLQWIASGRDIDLRSFLGVMERDRREMKEDVSTLIDVDGCRGKFTLEAMEKLLLIE